MPTFGAALVHHVVVQPALGLGRRAGLVGLIEQAVGGMGGLADPQHPRRTAHACRDELVGQRLRCGSEVGLHHELAAAAAEDGRQTVVLWFGDGDPELPEQIRPTLPEITREPLCSSEWSFAEQTRRLIAGKAPVHHGPTVPPIRRTT